MYIDIFNKATLIADQIVCSDKWNKEILDYARLKMRSAHKHYENDSSNQKPILGALRTFYNDIIINPHFKTSNDKILSEIKIAIEDIGVLPIWLVPEDEFL